MPHSTTTPTHKETGTPARAAAPNQNTMEDFATVLENFEAEQKEQKDQQQTATAEERVVKGTVVKVTDKQAVVDYGAKAEGFVPIAQVTDLPAAIPGSNFRTDSFPSVGVDQTSGAIYVTWSDATGELDSAFDINEVGAGQTVAWNASTTAFDPPQGNLSCKVTQG